VRAVIIEAPGVVRVDDLPEPEPGSGEVLLQVGACGICGTDLHMIDGEYPPATYPIVPGHELGGEVIAVGADVTGVTLGDRVGVHPALYCGACHACQSGFTNLCERITGVGVTSHQGGFAERLAVNARALYPLPKTMSFAAAALVEPLACVVSGANRLQPQVGNTYLIYGAGPIGLLHAQIAQFNGASLVALIDLNEGRLERARREFGVIVTGASLDDVIEYAPRGFDNVIEATGVAKVAELALNAVKQRGKLLIFGVCPPGEKAGFDVYRIYSDEITIIGSMSLLNSYGSAVDILNAGAIDVDRMVTHTFPIDKFPEAIRTVRFGTGLKVQVAGIG